MMPSLRLATTFFASVLLPHRAPAKQDAYVTLPAPHCGIGFQPVRRLLTSLRPPARLCRKECYFGDDSLVSVSSARRAVIVTALAILQAQSATGPASSSNEALQSQQRAWPLSLSKAQSILDSASVAPVLHRSPCWQVSPFAAPLIERQAKRECSGR